MPTDGGNAPIAEIIVYGAGGFAREVKDVVDAMAEAGRPVRCAGFFDDNPQSRGAVLNEAPVYVGDEAFAQWSARARFLVGIGGTATRRKVATGAQGRGARFATAVHPAAVMSRFVSFGEGTVVTAGVILTNRIRVGRHVILNIDTTVGHDCELEDFVTVSPGVHVSGNVRIGEGTDVGTGAVIIQGVRIGRWSVIGAGAVVTGDIPDNCTAVGVPAKVIKTRQEGWHLA